jgi:hypothetical protein
MSPVMTFSKPAACRDGAAAITPAAGPDSAVRTGRRRARCRGHDAAIGLHDVEIRRRSRRRQRPSELAEIARDDRAADRRSARWSRKRSNSRISGRISLEHETCVGPELAQRRDRRALVGRVGVGVDEDDGAGLAPSPAVSRGLSRTRRDRPWLRPCRRPASARHLQPQVAGHDGLEIAPQPQVSRPVAAAHLQHVAEAMGGDDADARALALQQRVGADRGAVHDGGDVAEIRHRRAAMPFRSPPPRRRGGRHLGDVRALPVASSSAKQVGEGAADIDADMRPAHASASLQAVP